MGVTIFGSAQERLCRLLLPAYLAQFFPSQGGLNMQRPYLLQEQGQPIGMQATR